MRILLLLMVIAIAMASDPAFTLVVDTTKFGSAANQFQLPLNGAYSATYNCTVDWGDGAGALTVTNGTTGFPNITHTYASSGVYSVKITENVVGGFPAIYFYNSKDHLKLMQIANWGGVTWATMNYAFTGCSNLTITATDEATAKTGSVTNFNNAWDGCYGLTSLPVLNTAAGTTFIGAWSNCSGLTSFPVLNTAAGTYFISAWEGCRGLTSFPMLNTAAGTSFIHAWFGCSGLTSFPVLSTAGATDFVGAWAGCIGLTSFPALNTALGTDFGGTWSGCSGLTSFPALNTAAGTSFSNAWQNCSGLTSFPVLNTAAGTDFISAWLGCRGLTSFPVLNTAAGTYFNAAWGSCSGLTSFPLLNTALGTDFGGTWYGCSGLTSFPALNTAAGTNFSNAWNSCSGLTSFPVLNLGRMTNGSGCFSGDTLTPASYSALLTNLAATNTNTGIPFGGGNSRYYASASTARNTTLIAGRNWVITDGGQVAAPTITNVSPSNGPLTSGPLVTITGTGFTGATGVTFGVNAATSVTAGSDTSITCLPPTGTIGSVTVTVNAPSGTVGLSGAYTYQPQLPFTLVVDTTKAGSAANQFVLPLNPSYSASYNCAVNWGDGAGVQTVTNGTTGFPNISHTYASSGVYSIKITENVVGGFPAIYFNTGGDRLKLTQIANWGGVTWASMNSAFSGCSNLTITATDEATASTGNLTDYSSAWAGCSGLTSFPMLPTAAGTNFNNAWSGCSGLTSFPVLNTAAGTNFSNAWSGCSGLTSFPVLPTAAGTNFSNAWSGCSGLTSFPMLNTAAGTNFYYAWFNCSGLTSFPVLTTAAGTNFSFAWAGCSGLTSFPVLTTAAGTNFSFAWYGCSGLTNFPVLNTAAGTNFSAAWAYCSGLTSFPVLTTAAGTNFSQAWIGCNGLTSFPVLNTAAGTDFSFAWFGCGGLTSFPVLNTAAGTNFQSAWSSCSGLTSFPLLITTAGTNFHAAWYGCSGLTSFPALNLGNMANGTQCFSGDTLTPASYSALLTNLASTNANTGVTFSGGNSRYYASAATARNTTLVTGKSWTITDGGQVAAPTITNVSPSAGPLSSGPQVTITGTGFTGATGVTFGVNAATSVTAVSNTSITCLPPTGTIGSVTVTVNAPSGTVGLSGAYTYQASQTITGFNAFGAHTYGDPAFTITGVTGGASGQSVVFTSGNPAVATVSGTTVTITGSGTAVITATQAGNTNYSAALAVPQTLTVTKAPLTVTAADTSRAFGAGNPSFTGTLTGVVNGDPITATYASSATATTAVGVYGTSAAEAITPTLVDPTARLGNYTVTSTKGTLTITSVAGIAQPQQTSNGAKCGMGSGFGAMAGLLVLMLRLALGAMQPAVRHAS